MFTFIGEVNFWSFDDNIIIKDADFGAFRYCDKRTDNVYEEGKRSYSCKRGMIYGPTNKKRNKLKDSIKYLEEQLKDNSIIYSHWYNDCILQLMLSNAIIIYIQINIVTGDIQKIMFDKYLIGKLPEHVADVMISRSHVICTYNDNQVAVVFFSKSKRHIFDKINKLEPKLLITDLSGPSSRRLDKKICMNSSGDMAIIWWKCTMNEVYPWSPLIKEHDRANIHLYRLTGMKLELLCYIRSEFDPLCIMFDTHHDNIIHSVEQKVSRKGEVTIEWHTYEVSQQDKLQRIAMVSVPLPTHTSCIKFSPNQNLLLLCCIDGSMIIYDQIRATTVSVKAAFIPTLASWHTDGTVFVIGNDRSQFQYFDISLSCIKSQILSEEATASNILDLSSYFRIQPALVRIDWNKKMDRSCYIDLYDYGNAFLLLLFQRGPVGVIKLIESETLYGDTLITKYLSLSQVDQATSLLLTMNWDTHPRSCMHSLNQILNYLFKLPLTSERENLIQNALGSFHVPVKPMSQSVEEEYGDEIRDLTRRFFHHLMRYQMFEKAFRLAIDLNDHDLFMDLHFYALIVNDMTMATSARDKAEQILSRSDSYSSTHSTCSRTSCSLCSDSASDKREESCSEDSEQYSKENHLIAPSNESDRTKEPNRHIPPLPVLHSHRNSKSVFGTSFNTSPSNKTDCNLVSTSFTMPTVTLHTASVTHSARLSPQTSFFTSTAFNKPTFKASCTSLSTSTVNFTNPLSVLKTASNDLMSTSFGSLSLSDSKLTSPVSRNDTNTVGNKSLLSNVEYSSNDLSYDNVTSSDTTSISTTFCSPIYNSIHVNIPNHLLSSSSDSANGNLMSTSFTTNVTETSTNYNHLFSNTQSTMSEISSSPNKNIQSLSTTNDFFSNTYRDTVSTEKLTKGFYNTSSNFMSTSFNFLDDQIVDPRMKSVKVSNNDGHGKSHQKLVIKKHVDSNIPAPPSWKHGFVHSVQDLPGKSFPLSQSTPGLLSIDETPSKKVPSNVGSNALHSLQKSNVTSNTYRNQQKYLNAKPRTYRLNYDLDYVPRYGSCDNIDIQSTLSNTKHVAPYFHDACNTQDNYEGRQARLWQYTSANTNNSKDSKISNIPPLPVITTSSSNTKICPVLVDTPVTSSEKPKVKFSDTVTHILVPEMDQSSKQKRPPMTQIYKTDPKQELAESLPLCLGNEDYLKNFQPLSRDDINEKVKGSMRLEETTKIKVVHFGLL